jgi:hypothetical protein
LLLNHDWVIDFLIAGKKIANFEKFSAWAQVVNDVCRKELDFSHFSLKIQASFDNHPGLLFLHSPD